MASYGAIMFVARRHDGTRNKVTFSQSFAYVNCCIQSLSFQTAHCKPVEPKKSNEEEEKKKNKVELERRTKSNTCECLIGGGWIGCLCFYNTNDSGCSFNSLFDILNFVRE